MSFDKYYPNRKDKRKQYYGSKAFDVSCRNHGACPYCKANRLHKHQLQQQKADYRCFQTQSIPSLFPIEYWEYEKASDYDYT